MSTPIPKKIAEKVVSWDYCQQVAKSRGFEGITDLLTHHLNLKKGEDTMSKETDTIRITIEYHGTDEVVHVQCTSMLPKEMRAVMVWLAQMPISKFPSTACAVGAHKLYKALSALTTQIIDGEDHASA